MKRCMVCGEEPTVKAHLFPRALMHDIRADETHVVGVKLNHPKPRFYQSGEWSDRIVCRVHEDVFGAADDYAVTFCRTFEQKAQSISRGDVIAVPNPRPDLLITFAHAVVWRHAAALIGRDRKHWLGPYFDRIGASLFHGEQPLQVAVLEPGNTIRGQRAFIGVHPCPVRMEEARLTRFEIGGLAFLLKTDQRRWPNPFDLFDADRDPLRVLAMDAQEVSSNPSFRAIAAATRNQPGE
jgi:hypothetical protein